VSEEADSDEELYEFLDIEELALMEDFASFWLI
jgi:hypothetical protein